MINARWRWMALASVTLFSGYMGLALWLGNEDESFYLPNGVDKVKFSLIDNVVTMEVHLNAPGSCFSVLENLMLDNLVISESLYVPACMEISETQFEVRYQKSSQYE